MNRLKIVKDLYDPSEREGMEDGDWLALVDGSAMGLLFSNKSLWSITEPVAKPIWELFKRIDFLEDANKNYVEQNGALGQRCMELHREVGVLGKKLSDQEQRRQGEMVNLDAIVTAVERIAKALK